MKAGYLMACRISWAVTLMSRRKRSEDARDLGTAAVWGVLIRTLPASPPLLFISPSWRHSIMAHDEMQWHGRSIETLWSNGYGTERAELNHRSAFMRYAELCGQYLWDIGQSKCASIVLIWNKILSRGGESWLDWQGRHLIHQCKRCRRHFSIARYWF